MRLRTFDGGGNIRFWSTLPPISKINADFGQANPTLSTTNIISKIALDAAKIVCAILGTILALGVGHAVPKRKFRTGCKSDAESYQISFAFMRRRTL